MWYIIQVYRMWGNRFFLKSRNQFDMFSVGALGSEPIIKKKKQLNQM